MKIGVFTLNTFDDRDHVIVVGEHYSKQANGPRFAQVSGIANGGRPSF